MPHDKRIGHAEDIGGFLQQRRLFHRRFRAAVPWSILPRQPTRPAQTGPVEHDHTVAVAQPVGKTEGPVAHVTAGAVDQHQVRSRTLREHMHRRAFDIQDTALRRIVFRSCRLACGCPPLNRDNDGQRHQNEDEHAKCRFSKCHKASIDRFPESSCRTAGARDCASGSAAATRGRRRYSNLAAR